MRGPRLTRGRLAALVVMAALIGLGLALRSHFRARMSRRLPYEFRMAVNQGHVQYAKLLLERHPQIVHSVAGSPPNLHRAIARGDRQMAELLLAHGADVNQVDQSQGYTALHYALARDGSEFVQLLLLHKADVNARDAQGKTVLHHCCQYGQKELPAVLLAHGADVNAKDNDGRTPLHHAVQYGGSRLVQEFLSAGANVDAADANGETPLHLAVRTNNWQAARLLVASGADLTARNKSGQPPWQAGPTGGRGEAVGLYWQRIKSLYQAGSAQQVARLLRAEPGLMKDASSPDGPLLHRAVRERSIELAGLLLANGADVNDRDPSGRTPLHVAADMGGTVEVVELLLAKGADPGAKDRNGLTPLELAIRDRREDVAAILRKHLSGK